MSFGAILLGILIVVASVAITIGIYYVVSGDWLWERNGPKNDRRNWPPGH
jgi:hypothetical protein